ncbi:MULTISPECIES: iron-containing alcohol dehydrogenase [Bacillus]|uniref:iron-containing alcohol dehydrogenase n=1 Tax=Bacillus TaxID=1386 RepID=UPI0002EF231A|nr:MULTISPECIES: iron-containing alcohol dehydrogenase [Bacillus]
MNDYHIFQSPQNIIYGKGSFEIVGKEAKRRGKKALIISDQTMLSLGFVDQCCSYLQQVSIESVVYLGVVTEPNDQYVAEALDICRSEFCDVVISIGGGSCIDTAKAVAVVSANGAYIGDYINGNKQPSHPSLPHIAIPTTAGTGSEVTDVTVITNSTNDVKMMIKQPVFLPTVAIVDPTLTLSSPTQITASTGIDALCHSIEAYLSRKAHPLTNTLALSSMKLLYDHLPIVYREGSNINAREAMALGSLQAGLAFSNASVCLVHGMSRPIGALFHVPHGLSNAMLLPVVLHFSKGECMEQLASIANVICPDQHFPSTMEAADFTVEAIEKLCETLEIPNLKQWGITKDEYMKAIPKMVNDAMESGSPDNNPRVPTIEELKVLYEDCYDYHFLMNH